ncbi:PqiC family protein [Entomobacter blattae]|uniref:ABC-type transport auxiliary lipoprotein component n=1 Tax=Entomobacter blattae TaxID=2762277 RepID=A0A7H1NPJ6_9PROT|nr:ABC-type transport auxiliary lipoprotein family protein [Entomobacter blattae]QNT77706.1 ABC-type transport auxiliary lipoprotein component [Entomobacter blattae]
MIHVKPFKIFSFLLLGAISACASPPIKLYTLGSPAIATGALPISSSSTVVAVSRVAVPSYLDTVDITVRRGVLLDHSSEGRLASRFSIGATDLITARLAQRHLNLYVTSQPLLEEYNYTLQININRFDITEEGNGTLSATWALIPKNQAIPVTRQSGNFTAHGPTATDDDTVKMGQNLLTQLADRITLP